MTKINRLTQIPTLDDSDLAVVWQDSSERTRAITIANLRKFIQSTDPNADAFVKAELVGDELILTAHDETETKIDINILPQHSVTELKDMPDNLISGHYLKVNDEGTDFVLTPASEISAAVILEQNGLFQGVANVLNFDDLDVEITNRIARISTKPVGGADGEIMKVENGKLVPSGVMSNKDGSLSLSSGSVDIGPHVISSSGEGIEATNESTGESYSFVFAGQGDDAGPVDRVFGDESVIKTTEDLSLQLTNHVSKLTATAETRIIKQPITIKPVAPQTNVTMQITDLNGSDLWTYGPFDMTVDENGNFEFTISTVLDFKVGEYLVTFLSPDGDVTLYGGISPISGEQIVYGELPFKPFHDETLHNIKTGGEIVREIEVGENATAELVDGKLTISFEGSELPENPTFKSVNIDTNGSGQPNFTASIHQDGELHTVIDATRELRINYKDIGTGTNTTVMGVDNNQAQFLVPIYQGNDQVALAKDIPNTSNFIVKHTNAELNKLFCAYQGKYNENRAFYPISLYQDVNGWTQAEFTGNMLFKSKGKDSGTVGDKVLELRSGKVVAHKGTELLADAIYEGDTSQPKNPVTREALDAEPQKEWFAVANGTLTTNGNRPTGGSGVEGELAVWHNVTSDSTTDPANELKVLFDGAYDKVDAFSRPLRFRLSQQSGTRNQYWTVDDNGWQTEGNVWHLSAVKVTGDNLVVGINTIVEASAYFIDDDVSAYHGQGVGVPSHVFINNGTNPTQTQPVALYANASNDASSRGDITLSKADGYDEFEVIIDCLTKPARDFRIKAGELGMYSDKRIRTSEVWSCRIKVDWNNSTNSHFYWTRLDNGAGTYTLTEEFNAKSGYNRLISGGGSTYTVTYGENGSILKISNPTVKVQLLQGMSDDKPHGYIKYINSHNDDVAFEWYDRNGNQVTSNVPSVCPADTVVEIFADYAKDQYVLNFGQSKVISTAAETAEMINNQATIDLICKSRYGSDCVYINTLTAEV